MKHSFLLIVTLLSACLACRRQQAESAGRTTQDTTEPLFAPAPPWPDSLRPVHIPIVDSVGILVGLTNYSGDSLVLFDLATDVASMLPETLDAIATSGRSFSIVHVANHPKPAQFNGRITADQFDHIHGPVYASERERFPSGTSAVVVNTMVMRPYVPLEVHGTRAEPLRTDELRRIQELRGLPIAQSWLLCTIAARARIALVHFTPSDSLNLLSFVAIDSTGITFEDHQGRLDDETSVWRVDDGGQIDPHLVTVLAALETDRFLYVVRAWAGAEGENIEVLRTHGSTLVSVSNAYRYWVPE